MALMMVWSAGGQTWTNEAGGLWGGSGNWVGGVANGSGAAADFSGVALADGVAVTVDGQYTVGRMVFGNQSESPAADWTVNSSGAAGVNYLTLATNSGRAMITLTNLGTGMVTMGTALTGTSSLQVSGPYRLLLSGANSYTGATIVTNGATVVIGAVNTLPTNTVMTLGDTNNGSAGNLDVENNQTVGGLVLQGVTAYTNTMIPTNVITIPAGQTLTVNGAVLAGYNPTVKRIATNWVKTAGGGTLVVNTNGGSFRVGATDQSSAAAGTTTILDLSGLGTVNLNLGTSGNSGTNGTVWVGDLTATVGSNVTSVLILGSNTTITANNVMVGNGGRVNTETLYLGAGNNVLNVNSNLLGTSRDEGQIYFYTNTGTLKLRGADGVSPSFMAMGYNVAGANGAPNQGVDFGDHNVDALLSSLIVGQDQRAGYNSNYFGFGNGTLTVTSLRVGNRSGTPTTGASLWQGICNVSGGVVQIGTGGIVMGTSAGSVSAGTATNEAVLNLSGGMVTVSNDIVLLTQKATTGNELALSYLNISGGTNVVYGDIYSTNTVASPGPRQGTLTLSGGVLDLTGHAIGGINPTVNNAVSYVEVLNWEGGTLRNVGQINGGTKGLVVTGPGTLTLDGTNTYTGGTTVSNGTLLVNGTIGTGVVVVMDGSVLTLGTGGPVKAGYIGVTDNLVLDDTSTVNLSFTGTNAMAALSLDGGATFQTSGTWGSSTSSAVYKSARFQGPGILLTQLQIPTPTTITLAASNNTSTYGQAEVYTATVTGTTSLPTGTVSFYSGSVLLGTVALSGGVAILTTSALPVGTDSVTALYNGDGSHETSLSGAWVQEVSLAPAPSPFIQPSRVNGTNVLLRVGNTVAGYDYFLESSPTLTPPILWTPVFTTAGTGADLTNLATVDLGTPAQFFHFKVVAAATAPLALIDTKGAHAIIIIGDDAPEVEQFAAGEFQSYVAQMTGVTLPIVSAATAALYAGTNEIVIGRPETNGRLAQLCNQYNVSLDTNSLGVDGYIIKSINTGSNTAVILAGSNPRSSLFATYDLLEKLGVRFFGYKSRNGEIVPAVSSLAIPDWDITEKPGMDYRFVSCNNYSPTNTAELIDVADWGAKNRCNAFMLTPVFPGLTWSQIDLDEVQKRGFLIAGPGHILAQLTPSTNLFKAHPEYFPLINGVRSMVYSSQWGGALSFCYTNAMAIVVSNAVAYYKQNPFIDLLAIFPPDGSQHAVQCQDAICSKLSMSDWYLTLLNNIDQTLRQLPSHPKLMWISYDELGVTPTNVVPYDQGRDFILEWCNQIRDFNAPMNSSSNLVAAQYLQWDPTLISVCTDWIKKPGNVNLAAGYRWQSWSNYLKSCQYAGGVSFLDYYNLNVSESLDVPLMSYCQTGPWPGNMMQEDFEFYVSQGIDGWQNCTDYYNDSPTPYWNRLSARLMWHPEEDVTAIDRDFYQHLYGPAWAAMDDYYTALWMEMGSLDFSSAGVGRVQTLSLYLNQAAGIAAQTNNATLNYWLGRAQTFQAKCLQIKAVIPGAYNADGSPISP
jgi:autotransporter-associated beta strand protein